MRDPFHRSLRWGKRLHPLRLSFRRLGFTRQDRRTRAMAMTMEKRMGHTSLRMQR